MSNAKLERLIANGGAVSPSRPKRNADATPPTQRKRIGHAAQHMVATDLLLRGYDCSISAELLAYDLIADINGLRRVQVKCRAYGTYRRTGTKELVYEFMKLAPEKCDLFAFVILPERKLIYRRASWLTANFLILPASAFDISVDRSFWTATESWRKSAHSSQWRSNA